MRMPPPRARWRATSLCAALAASLLLPAALLLRATPAGADGLQLHGLFDLGTSSRGEAYQDNAYTMGDSPFDPWGVRLMGDGSISPKFTVFTQAVLHDPSKPYVESAYLQYTPRPARDMQLIVGKIPWLIGTYCPRSYSDKNPLIGSPMLYQYHTTLLWYGLPANADALLAVAGQGQESDSYYGAGTQGMAVVDNGYWDTGLALTGSSRPLEYALGFTTGTPGWANTGEDENKGKSVMGRLGVAPTAGLRAGVSGAYGPYLVEGLDARLPRGTTANDYHQKLVMADAEFERGHVEFRTEGYANAWETPNLGDLGVHGAYFEGRVTLLPGVWAAARGEVMRFSTVTDSLGAALPWDNNRDRIELGLGYRPERAVRIKAVWQRNIEMHGASVPDEHYDLYALQVSTSF